MITKGGLYNIGFLLLPLILQPALINAQSWNWVKVEPAWNDPYPNYQEHIIAVDDSGNVYFTGNYAGISLVKYDHNGNLLWDKYPSLTNTSNFSHSVAQNFGYEYITGEFRGNLAFGNDTLMTTGTPEMFLSKYDTSGNVLWARESGGTGSTRGESVATDSVGNAYVGGNFTGPLIFGKDTFVSSYESVFLVKYDKNGNYKWCKVGIGQNNGYPNGVYAIVSDILGDVFICGYYRGDLVFGTDTLPSTPTYSTAFAIKYDVNGNLKWLWTPNIGTCNSDAFCIAADNIGNAFICGEFNSGTFTTGSVTLNPIPGVYNPYFLKIKANSNVGWVKQAIDLNSCSWVASSIVTDSLYDIFLLLNGQGYTNYKLTVGTDTFKINRYQTADVILELDSSGNEKCGSIFTEGGEDDGDGMNVSPSGKYVYAAGDIYPKGVFGNDSISGSDTTFFLASWQPCNRIETSLAPISNKSNVKVFPNPNKGSFTLSLSNINEKCIFNVYNIIGENIYKSKINSTNTEIDLNAQLQGIYFYRILKENGDLIENGKLIKEN